MPRGDVSLVERAIAAGGFYLLAHADTDVRRQLLGDALDSFTGRFRRAIAERAAATAHPVRGRSCSRTTARRVGAPVRIVAQVCYHRRHPLAARCRFHIGDTLTKSLPASRQPYRDGRLLLTVAVLAASVPMFVPGHTLPNSLFATHLLEHASDRSSTSHHRTKPVARFYPVLVWRLCALSVRLGPGSRSRCRCRQRL